MFSTVLLDPNSPGCYSAARPTLHLASAVFPSLFASLLPISVPPPPLPEGAECIPHLPCSPLAHVLAFLPPPIKGFFQMHLVTTVGPHFTPEPFS